MDELREKMAEKRAKKAAQEAKEAQANETIRRKSGKVSRALPTMALHPLKHICNTRRIWDRSRRICKQSRSPKKRKRSGLVCELTNSISPC